MLYRQTLIFFLLRFHDGIEMAHQPGCHWTFISNVGCKQGHVRVFETLPAFRNKNNFLTEESKRILKVLTSRVKDKLKVKAVNVASQVEHECGSLSVALAYQFLFYNKNVFNVCYDTRQTLLDSFKNKALLDFKFYLREVQDKYLFEVTI